MATLVYAPGVQITIATRKSGIIDVSDDLQQGSITLNANAPHSASFSLLNMGRKYDGIFTPNDRISIRMKRITWLQIMAGYLDEAPLFSAFPRTVSLSATCSLKRLKYFLWDSGTSASYQLIHGPGAAGTDPQNAPDSGLKQIAMRMLVDVAGWPIQNIHIGGLPHDWFNRISDLWSSVQTQIEASKVFLGAGATINGASAINNGQVSVDAEPTHQLPNTSGTASWFAGPGDSSTYGHNMALSGDLGQSPKDPWYCAMRWPYAHYVNGKIVVVSNANEIINWWANRKILVVAPTTNKAVVLRAADWGPGGVTTADRRVIDMSQEALEQVLQISTNGEVNISFAPPDAPLGPYTPSPAGPGAQTVNSLDPGTTSSIGATGAQAAIAFVEAQVGKPYQYGGTGNPSYDCSGLTQAAWKAAGLTLPRTSEQQWNAITRISAGDLQPGDLIFYEGVPPGHVTLYVGGGQMVEAPHTGTAITLRNVYPGAVGYGRVPGAIPGTAGPLTNDPAANGQGPFLGPGSGWIGSPPQTTDASNELTGVRALMNDTPLLPDIQSVLFASMRSYCSAPNGDFIAWFPDYFGQYGTCGKVVVQPIELQDFSIVWSDINLITHEFAVGAQTGTANQTSDPNAVPVDEQRMFYTSGIASVEFPQILAALFNIQPGDDSVFADAKSILDRFGARMNYEELGIISSDEAEFWYALFRFMQIWTEQFNTVAPMTFMPELFPGMLVEFAGYGVQCYISGVTHNFSFAEGGGFSTNAQITAPSSTDGKGIYGLVKAGPRAPALPPVPTLGTGPAGTQPTPTIKTPHL